VEWGEPLGGSEPLGYLLHVGSRAGADDIANGFRVTRETFLDVHNVPPGRYHLRIRAFNLAGVSRPSEDVVFVVGPASCGGVPEAPADLAISVSGGAVTLSWADSPTVGLQHYRIEAGPAGGPFSFSTLVPASTTSLTVPASPGAFDVRVRAVSSCGESLPSNTGGVAMGGAAMPPQAPENLEATVSGHAVTITWLAPSIGGAPTTYVLEAGSGPGLADLASVPIGGTALAANGVPPGTYFVRVRAMNPAGTGSASEELVVTVP
jgi:predicted phage tail protein